jgi:hypothetical protein
MALMTKYGKTKKYDPPLYEKPESTEQLYPVKAIDDTGIFSLNCGRYSKCFMLSDINFAGVTDSEQKMIIINFSRVLNSINCRFSYTVANEYVDEAAFSKRILYRKRGDGMDKLCDAYNEVINASVTGAKQGLYQTIYLTLTVEAGSVKEARNIFGSIEATLGRNLIQIGISGMAGATIEPIGVNERLQTWYNFTHSGIRTNYKFNYAECIGQGRNWKDIVSPESMVFYNDYFVMNGNRYGRVMYISKHAQSLDSNTIAELAKINSTNYITINNELLDSEGFKQEITRKHSSVGLKIEREKKRNRDNNDFLADASDKLLTEKDSIIGLSKMVDSGDDHFFNTTAMIMFLAKDMNELNEITDAVIAVGGTKSFELKPCFDKQREGINSTFMFGVQEFKRCANLSSPCLAMYMPFKTQELNDVNGTYYGINKLSQNPILADRKLLQSYHGMILGKTRSGKSVFAKCEIISNRCLHPEDQILIIDPQNEYKGLAYAPGVNGSVVSFDTQKEVYVNPMDVNFEGVDYAMLQEIISEKTDFILTLLSSCMRRDIDAAEQGVLDKVIEQVYSENYAMRKKANGDMDNITEFSVPKYMQKNETILPIENNMTPEEQERAYSPTLQDVYQKLLDMDDNAIARKLAAHMQIFVNGSLNLFNHKTNVDLNRKFLVFDISGIKSNLRITCMLVMLEIIKNKIKQNFSNNCWTNCYIDEFHELLGIRAVADYVIKLWKEVGKLHGSMTGITQNMTDLLSNSPDSDRLAAILSNTEYFAMLNQSSVDRKKLAEFLPMISPAMFDYVEGAMAGTGLLKMGAVTVPFDMRMSKDCMLYSYVNTDGYNQESAI